MKTMRFEVVVEMDGECDVCADDAARDIGYYIEQRSSYMENIKVMSIPASPRKDEGISDDTARLNWLATKQIRVRDPGVENVALLEVLISEPAPPHGVNLREGIDQCMRPKPKPRYVRDMSIGDLADIPPVYDGNNPHGDIVRLNKVTDMCRALVEHGMDRKILWCRFPFIGEWLVERSINSIIKD